MDADGRSPLPVKEDKMESEAMNHSSAAMDHPSTMVRQHWNVLRRHVSLLILIWIALAAAAVVFIALLPDVYQATTTILVDPQKIPERYVASTVTSDPNDHLNTLKQQVLSTSRLQQIIDHNNLYPTLRRAMSREEVLEYMRKKIKIELKQGSDQGLSSFTITYEDQDRAAVATIANQLAASFIDWNLQVRQQQATDTTQFLSSELEQAKKSLEEQEGQLEAFRLKHVGSTPDQLDGNLQTISRLQSQMQSNADAISRLDEERIMLTQSRPAVTPDLSSLSERDRLVQEKRRLENELWKLRRDFTDTYPDVVLVKGQLQSVTARLAAMPAPSGDIAPQYDSVTQARLTVIARELDRHRREQSGLEQQVSSYQSKVDTVPVLETQLTELTRNYETSRQNYQSLLDKRMSAGMSQDLERKQQAEHFIVLDQAKTPEKPIRPRRLPLMLGAVVGSLLLTLAGILGVQMLLGRIDSEAQLRSLLPENVPVLGTIPPIVSRAERRHKRIALVRTLTLSAAICAAVMLFLHKVRPTL
jgi:polysaccharide chain length determinant protein (PEP-CTERM system associated)